MKPIMQTSGHRADGQRGKRRVAFVVDLGFQEILSIPILSAIAKARGHATELFVAGRNLRKLASQVAAFAPDIVAYSVCSNEVDRYLQINRFLKEHMKVFSLFGGAHPTFFPEFVETNGVDAICRGEADRCFAEFLDRFGTDDMYGVSNFAFERLDGRITANPLADLVNDLDALPVPDRDLLYAKDAFMARSPIKTFMAGRGCPYNCSYCYNHVHHALYRGKGKILRTKSVGYLLDEIRGVAKTYPLTFIRFLDDIFGMDRAWLAEFADRYPTEIGLPFTCYARPNMATEAWCRQVRKAGCYSVYMAIECGNERLRNSGANRGISDEQIEAACRNLQRCGIRIATFNMVGMPGETEAEMLETVDLNHRLGVDLAVGSVCQPYPGTALNEYCKERGYLDESAYRFESPHTQTVLKLPEELKQKIYVVHKLFPMLVDHPRLKGIMRALYRADFLNGSLTVLSKVYYGRNIHRRIYDSQIPWGLRLRGALGMLASKSRS